MKKIILGTGIMTALVSFSAFKIATYEPKKSSAEVEQYEGLYIFTDSKPLMETEYLGTVKSTFGATQYEDVRDKLIKKAKKEFPKAEALIISLKAGGTDKCDAIKFK